MDDYKIYDKARLAFEKLEVSEGDIVVVKFPDDILPEQMSLFAEGLQEHTPPGVLVLCTRAGVEIETFTETEMNKHGWYKFDTTKRPN